MKLTDFKGINEYPLPKKFNCVLRDYQLAGYNWLRFLHESGFNGCLADDMGLGKTVQTLCLLQSLKELKLLKTSMVVAPVSTIPNWEREAERFCPGLKTVKFIGLGREKNISLLQKYDLIITSYQTLARDVEMVSGMELTYLILDESQVVKNSRTIAYRAVSVLKCSRRLALSGTPVENSSFELWSLMNFLNPGLLGSEKEFRSRFALAIEKHEDSGAANLLRRKIHPFILRRKKGEVAKELPPRTEIVRYVEMEGNQAKAYEIVRKRCLGMLEDVISEKGIANSSIEILAAITRLRQVSLFPVLADPAFEKVPSCKFLELKEMLSEILSEGDNKIIIFSQFVKALTIIKAHCKGIGRSFSYIDGSTKNRDDEIQRFQNDPDTRIFLISLKAGGFGINLTAADYVILFDPWWNPAVESQAIDRAHRIGRIREVIAYRLIAKGTIEEKMLIIQEKKKALFDQLIAEDAGFMKRLTQDDLMELFN
jgi:SNF2 family DNA or RNA helicase